MCNPKKCHKFAFCFILIRTHLTLLLLLSESPDNSQDILSYSIVAFGTTAKIALFFMIPMTSHYPDPRLSFGISS
ncbi:hypothetical protein EDC94DRAFT_605918 [Helicostylum pulchrum]|nr:hypothetical protein EDC94DRAFT_605918 [Helicostylum pulchrum]